MTQPAEARLIYPQHHIQVVHHNVVGAGGVLGAIDQETQQLVGDHYDQRSPDQFMRNENPTAHVLSGDPRSHKSQLTYRGAIAGIDFDPIASLQEIEGKPGTSALYVPYIHLATPALPKKFEWQVYGLPVDVTARLKNKAEFHNLLIKDGFAEHTPNHITAPVTEIAQRGSNMLNQINAMYKAADLGNEYPLGLMIRGAEADGNYGAVMIKQSLTNDQYVNSKGERNGINVGQIMLMPDGKKDKMQVFDSWETALSASQDHMKKSMDPTKESRVVMSRLIDLQDSPGMSAVIVAGTPHMLNWNGQWQEPGESACTGTTSPGLTNNSPEIQKRFLEQTQTLFANILDKQLGNRPDKDQIYAMANLDLMITGKLEQKLWNACTTPSLSKYRSNIAKNHESFQPRTYNPNIALIAESNARDTNWTIALKAVMTALHRDMTVANLLHVANGKSEKIIARDAWRLPPQIQSMDAARSALLGLHNQLAQDGGGFILRMPTNSTAGAIAWTSDGSNPLNIYNQAYQALQAYQSLQ